MHFVSTHSCLDIFTIIYLQWISPINSQYLQIWYDSMLDCSNWNTYGTVYCGYISDGGGCEENPCVRMDSDDVIGWSSLDRVTNIASYSSLRIEVSVSTYLMESSDVCKIYCQYDDELWTDLATINPPNDGNLYRYLNSVYDLPSAVGKTNLIIYLRNEAGADDRCYWDNVFLRGIPEISATPEELFYSFIFEQPSDWTEDIGSFNASVHSYEPIVWRTHRRPSQECPRQNMSDTSCIQFGKDASLSRTIPTIGYRSIRLQIDVHADGCEQANGDWCVVQYRTDELDWHNVNVVTGQDHYSLDFEIIIPDISSYNNEETFQVKVGINADTGGDNCFFDNLQMFGIPYTQNPTNPSANPSARPSNEPSFNPSMNPSKRSFNPSQFPSKYPTVQPTTSTPSSNPTFPPNSPPMTSFAPTSPPNSPPMTSFAPTSEQITTHSDDESVEGNGSDVGKQSKQMDLKQIFIIITVVLVCLIGMIIVYICLRMKESRKRNFVKNAQQMQQKQQKHDANRDFETRNNGRIINAHKVMQGSVKVTKADPNNDVNDKTKIEMRFTCEGSNDIVDEDVNKATMGSNIKGDAIDDI
eukprot:552669_1